MNWQHLRGFLSSDLFSSSDFSVSVLAGAADPNENPDFVDWLSVVEAEDPNENPDFSPDSTVLVLAADPNAKPVPVPNLTGSSEVFGAESAEPLPKTAPEIVKKMSKLVGYFVQSH